MILEKMNHHHIEAAAKIAVEEYFEERRVVPILPEGNYHDILCKMIGEIADSSLGTVAIENGKLIGFLTCWKPMQNHFGTTQGVFSPVHGHGTVKENRRRIYAKLYQEASEKWINQGILSHAVALYTHNEGVDSFFWNGFGLRCIDAIRPVEPIECSDHPDVKFCELPMDEIEQIVPLKNQLLQHLRSTPMYIPLFFQYDVQKVMEETKRRSSRFFVAKLQDEVIAFVEIMGSGENFACESPGTTNICGAYLLPQFRGMGIYTKLLSFLMDTLKVEGYIRCGVDFESFNPTASGFWLKYFTPYTYSVTRRIDERIAKNYT